jgi:hypothetical protein
MTHVVATVLTGALSKITAMNGAEVTRCGGAIINPFGIATLFEQRLATAGTTSTDFLRIAPQWRPTMPTTRHFDLSFLAWS